MKTNAIVRIILFSIAILVLVGILTIFLLGDLFMIRTGSHHVSSENLPMASDGETVHSVVPPSSVKNIDIEWAAGSITIEPLENAEQITVRETSDPEHPMELYLDGSTLKIRFTEESLRFGIIGINETISKDLVITVPSNWVCGSLDIDAASAEVNIHDLTFDEIDFSGASGECNFTNCTVNELDLETVSGNVSFYGCVTDFNCEAVSADCQLELLNQARSITVESVSGDLKLVLPEACGFSCESETVSGSFKSEFDCTSHGDVYIHGDGSCQIKLGGVSGDVQILKSSTPKNCDH